jgi:putative component of toxin-antitoxin plasmid stabilization module
MFTVYQTEEFVAWLDDLKNKQGQLRISARLRHVESEFAAELGEVL